MYIFKNAGTDPLIILKLKDSSAVYLFKKGSKEISTKKMDGGPLIWMN